MAADIWTVAGAVIALAAINIGLFAWLRADIRELRGELGELRTQTAAKFEEAHAQTAAKFAEARVQAEEARAQTAEQFGETNAQLGLLRERMAHLEGLLDGLREAIAGRRAA